MILGPEAEWLPPTERAENNFAFWKVITTVMVLDREWYLKLREDTKDFK